jgi:filamentous hemagglutinin family protein
VVPSLTLSVKVLLAPVSARAGDLPVACSAGTCGSFVSSGSASAVLRNQALDIKQTTQNAVLNWQSFDIDSAATVTFDQPSSSAIALNRIHQASASEIYGALKANGRVYLVNQNGILFGDGARVNVGGLVASALDITPAALENGIAQAAAGGQPAFARQVGQPSGAVVVDRGATIETTAGGQVFLFAPENVSNAGKIATPDGQTILAAGQSVYLATSSDENLRGILVEVDNGGVVTNGVPGGAAAVPTPQDIVGQLVAERGNVTLAGLAVNQLGRVSATTSVRANGSIRLQARDTVLVSQVNGVPLLLAQQGGDLTVGTDAVNEVTLTQDDPQTQVDVNAQPRSTVLMDGAQVRLLENSRTTATAGNVDIYARRQSQASPSSGSFAPDPDDSKLYLASGATIDVAGANIELPMERNVVRAELRASQLADSPEQRDGPLRGQAVYVDIRQSGTRADGTVWQGTPLADVSGDIAAVGRTVGERSLIGGTVSLQSQGSVLVAEDALVDVAGGSIRYLDGQVTTTQLLADGRVYDIASADPSKAYDGIGNTVVVKHERWGVTETFVGFGGGTATHFERGYVEGKDAGAIDIVAPWFAFDGRIDGSTVRGAHQRVPSAPLATGQVNRAYDQVAVGGRLTLGFVDTSPVQNFVLGDLAVTPGLILPGLQSAGGFDPSRDTLIPAGVSSTLRPDLIGPTGVSSVAIQSNGRVSLAHDVSLLLPPGGELTAAGANVAVDGVIAAPSGSIGLTARPSITTPTDVGLTVGATAALLATGRWVNDGPLTNVDGALPDSLHTNGGKVDLAVQQGALTFAAGSVIDVTAGAWLTREGVLTPGVGGSVSLATTPINTGGQTAAAVPLRLDGEIRGHSIGEGGRLAIVASAICIADADCAREANELWIAPSLLEESGFGSYSLRSNRGGVALLGGTDVDLRQRSLRLESGNALRPSAESVAGFTNLSILDDLHRRPVDLSIMANINVGTDVAAVDLAILPGLSIGTGSNIRGDLGARLALEANTVIDVEGTLLAPAGSISVALNNSLTLSAIPDSQGTQFPDSQGIWLGDTARLLTPGAVRLLPNDLGRRAGEVLNGGAVSVTAQRGYIVTLPGSVIDVSGTAATLDLRSTVTGEYEPKSVAGDAGSIALTAAEGMVLNGALLGKPADSPGARGGLLDILLDPLARGDRGNPASLFPVGPRTIIVSDDTDPLIIPVRANVPRTFNGIARIGAADIERGGFDSLRLTARELEKRSTGPLELGARGVIRFEGRSTLDLARSIELDAAVIEAWGANATLRAPFVSIGASSRRYQSLPTSIAGGSGTLVVEADLLELVGNVAMQGLGSTHFSSAGDIRVRGVQLLDSQLIEGSLVTSGDLVLAAEQLYPTTLTRFGLVANEAGRSIRVVGVGESGSSVLSAGGHLTLQADTIDQQGALRAPFGAITLSGERVTLGTGSVTSTSGAGLLIPFGQTQGGFDWVYPLLDDQTLVFGRGDDELPQQRVTLDGTDVRVKAGATVDLSGGGDLLAYEFEPGVNGTHDVLANAYRPNQYAIVPNLDLDYAPFDPSISLDAALGAGDRVWLDGLGELAAGFYTLLPARYALLPGSYLVTATSGHTDILPGEHLSLLDGGTVIAGYRATAGTDRRDSRYSGFAVRLGTAAGREARYTRTEATQFFQDLAASLGDASPRLPIDAGVLSIGARSQLEIAGSLIANGAANGRGAGVDVSSTRLRVVPSPAVAEPGEVVIEASALNSLGAESLLLGASRTQDGDGVRLDVAAERVTIGAGAELRAPEVILAATDRVALESGAVVEASGTHSRGDDALLLQGSGALLRVSSGEQVRVDREGAGTTAGALNLDEGSVVRAEGGAVLLEATGDSAVRGQLLIPKGSLNLAASRISLGQDSDPISGLILDAAELAALDLDELVLTSRSTLDLYGSVDLSVQALAVHAAGIVNRSADGDAMLAAQGTLRLANPNAAPTPSLEGGTGLLTLAAQNIELGAGDFVIDGAETVELRGGGELRALDVGSTHVSGDLVVAASAITTASGAERTIAASGLLRTDLVLPIDAGSAEPPGLGGRLTLRADRVFHGGRIEMPGGDVEIVATGDAAADRITLASGSSIVVAGTMREFDGVQVFAPAGNVSLIADHGSVIADAGSIVDVSGHAAGGDAGEIVATAVRGAVAIAGSWLGNAAAGFQGGSFFADAADIAGVDGLVHALNAAGFTRSLAVRLRGPGDISVSGASVTAHAISLTADQGAVNVSGVLDARGASGGSIDLIARDDVVVGGSLLANATQVGGHGGRVSLSSTLGGATLGATSLVDVTAGAASGAEPIRAGEVTVRVSRQAANSVLDGDPANDALALTGRVEGAGRYWLEGFQAYASDDGFIDAADVAALPGNPLFDDALSFMSNASAIANALGRGADASFKVVPGIEFRSSSDLKLVADWNLYDWHFANDTPGILTLRAAGDLIFERSLSDGFAYVPDPSNFDLDAMTRAFTLDAQPRESWSYRLIGGADLASADSLATVLTADLAADQGDVEILPGGCCVIVDPFSPPDYRLVRTGTGDIAVRAARDFVLGNAGNRSSLDQTAMLYTAGVAGPGIGLPGDFGGLNALPYPIDGGDISIRAGGSIRGAVSNQLVTDWLWRVGSPADSPSGQPSPTAWTVNHRSFMQGIGALAGGDIEIRAEGDVENLSVSLPTIGRQVGGLDVRDNKVEVVGAGDLRVTAGGSILGGTYVIGNGSAVLRSRGSVGAPATSQVPGFAAINPLLGVSGSGQFDLIARTDLAIESVFNPTLIPQGNSQQVFSGRSYFASYSDESRVALASITGDLLLNNDTRTAEILFSASAPISGPDSSSLLTYPGTLRAVAFDGDVAVPRSMFLFPASKGNVELFAGDSVILGRPDSAMVMALSDADRSSVLPSVERPAGDLSVLDALVRSPFDPRHHASVPVHSLQAQADGIADLVPARVVARTGDVFMNGSQQAGVTGAYFSKPARIVAAGDIRDLTLFTQHSSERDTTTLQAGGSIFYRLGRNPLGILEQSSGAIVVDGPGRLEFIAGRDLNLQTSTGVVSRGNLFNPALPNDGASISVLAGVGEQPPDYEAFADRYLRDGTVYDTQLIAYLSAVTAQPPASKGEALESFESLPTSSKAAFLERILLTELRSSGREAAASTNADFGRGFTALETMFPGANPDVESGESNPYSGDINLYFSRIYTLDGGDIDLLAPGGQINAGLATPPTAFGITKSASELGIVAQSSGSVSALAYDNFAVNESRVFAADGGDILVWSTRGDIDAGRGAKTAISAPRPVVSFDSNGNVQVSFPAALAGSGIQTLATSEGRKPGNVDLFAPRGVVNAGDAGIVAGNLTIAATAVLGADNISVSGVAVGVPVDTGGFAAALTGVSAVASSATNAAQDTVTAGRQQESSTPLADEALGFLDVFVTGFGEGCDPQDEDCEQE